MSQRNVELLIGRLLTDDELRGQFVRDPRQVIEEFMRQGWELTPGECEALASTDTKAWADMAARIPSRLRRCNLRAR
jgi:hypothetical protein